jgi:hypothetical protein
MARHHLPWARATLLLVVPSGLLAAAGLNALVFHRGAFRTVTGWESDTAVPPTARAAAVASLVLWVGVITAGRLLAYL